MTDTDQLQSDLLGQIAAATTPDALEAVRVAALGKSGSVTALLKTLGGLSPEDRSLMGPRFNGLRETVSAALTAKTIRLDCDVPHISIEPEGRQLKSHYARRVIPLTGVSLEAFKQYPQGFPRYRNRATLSAVVIKFLRANGLLETPRHSFYSLRHSFEDRMLAAGIDDRIRRDLFGHRLDRERYGKGASLEHVAELVTRIAF
jgi:integrase